MMNADEFIKHTDRRLYYAESCIKSILYGYQQLLKSNESYSRNAILNTIRQVQQSDKSLNEIEDYLCDDLVIKYIRPNKHLFGLEYFTINTGVRETKSNVKIGIIDIKFELSSLVNNNYYVFEAKRLNKYSPSQQYYITGGIKRFIDRIYYSESNNHIAGMVAFVEVDQNKFPKGKVPIEGIIDSINNKIKNNKAVVTTQLLNKHKVSVEYEDFQTTYISKHMRQKDGIEMIIYHVILDYYDLLKN